MKKFLLWFILFLIFQSENLAFSLKIKSLDKNGLRLLYFSNKSLYKSDFPKDLHVIMCTWVKSKDVNDANIHMPLTCSSPFIPALIRNKRTVIIIFDLRMFKDSFIDLQLIGVVLFLRGYNAIFIEWNAYQSNYPQAISNIEGIAYQIRHNIINKMNVSRSKIHIIGMGVGAHIAGCIGKGYLRKKIGRITGLNPARKFIEYEKDLKFSRKIKLSENDASFVDVYHTDYKGKMRVGCTQRLGTVDFYARLSNRTKLYPGCHGRPNLYMSSTRTWLLPFFEIQEIISQCSHSVAARIFLRTLFKDCNNWGVRKAGDVCKRSNCIPLGLLSVNFITNSTKGTYMLSSHECVSTIETEPYLKYILKKAEIEYNFGL